MLIFYNNIGYILITITNCIFDFCQYVLVENDKK